MSYENGSQYIYRQVQQLKLYTIIVQHIRSSFLHVCRKFRFVLNSMLETRWKKLACNAEALELSSDIVVNRLANIKVPNPAVKLDYEETWLFMWTLVRSPCYHKEPQSWLAVPRISISIRSMEKMFYSITLLSCVP